MGPFSQLERHILQVRTRRFENSSGSNNILFPYNVFQILLFSDDMDQVNSTEQIDK